MSSMILTEPEVQAQYRHPYTSPPAGSNRLVEAALLAVAILAAPLAFLLGFVIYTATGRFIR